MKIQEIEITDIGGIPYLKLDNLDPHMNIVCGENGVGKTNILRSIEAVFHTSSDDVKKRAGSKLGQINVKGEREEGVGFSIDIAKDAFEPTDSHSSEYYNFSKLPFDQLIFMGTNREFDYQYLDSLFRSPTPENYETNYPYNKDLAKDIKNWFIQMTFLDKSEFLETNESYNISTARDFINKLDSGFSFLKVTKFHEIVIQTPSGEVYFEYLSSGFKSSFFILLGILKEIDFKLGNGAVPAIQYEGVILIDEIELHLHPQWQAKIINILKESFPKAQFFITTHSPHVIQSAQHNEIIALEKTESSREGVPFEVVERDLPDSLEYGFQGWTIEEVLEDVMGMQNTRGQAYEKYIKKFDAAIDNNSKIDAEKAYSELKKMLHPNSHVRKMLQLEMIGLE